MTKLALVGCAHIHTPGFVRMMNERDDVSVKLVWDHNAERAAMNAAKLGANVAALDEIWADDEIAAVVITSETNLHEQLVMAACSAEKHLFVEKPLGMAGEDAQRMADAIDKAGVIFQTGYFMRGFPHYLFVKDAIEKGWFGRITRIQMSNGHHGSLDDWFTPEWLWMTNPAVAGVGAFGDLGTHVLDIMLWLIDAKVLSVTAKIDTAIERYGKSCDEFGTGILEFRNGVLGTIAAGWVDLAEPIPFLISGTEGHAYVHNDNFYFKSKHVEDADGKSPWTNLPEKLPHAFGLFLDAITSKRLNAGTRQIGPRLVTPKEAAYRNTIMEAMIRAASTQSWVPTWQRRIKRDPILNKT